MLINAGPSSIPRAKFLRQIFFFWNLKEVCEEVNYSLLCCVHEINENPHFFTLSISCYVPRWRNKRMRSPQQRGWVHSQQDMSYISGKSQMFFTESSTGLSCDSFCIVYIIHLPKHRSEVWFSFHPLNLSKIQHKKTFSDKLLHLLLSS